MSRSLVLLLISSSLLSSACAQKGLYDWGSYEDDLRQLYKSPETERRFGENLKLTIDKARKNGVKTPPGVAAEYGFLQYRAGQPTASIEYFDLERRTWPESATLMTRLIERIRQEEPEQDVRDPVTPQAEKEP